MKALKRLAWAPICLVFGHVYIAEDRRPFVDTVICKDCGKRKTGEPTIKEGWR